MDRSSPIRRNKQRRSEMDLIEVNSDDPATILQNTSDGEAALRDAEAAAAEANKRGINPGRSKSNRSKDTGLPKSSRTKDPGRSESGRSRDRGVKESRAKSEKRNSYLAKLHMMRKQLRMAKRRRDEHYKLAELARKHRRINSSYSRYYNDDDDNDYGHYDDDDDDDDYDDYYYDDDDYDEFEDDYGEYRYKNFLREHRRSLADSASYANRRDIRAERRGRQLKRSRSCDDTDLQDGLRISIHSGVGSIHPLVIAYQFRSHIDRCRALRDRLRDLVAQVKHRTLALTFTTELALEFLIDFIPTLFSTVDRTNPDSMRICPDAATEWMEKAVTVLVSAEVSSFYKSALNHVKASYGSLGPHNANKPESLARKWQNIHTAALEKAKEKGRETERRDIEKKSHGKQGNSGPDRKSE